MFARAIFGVWLLVAGAAAAADAFDVTEKRTLQFQLTDKDIVRKSPELRGAKREFRFIGDLEIGESLSDETVFRRSVEIANPTDQVYSSVIKLSVERGTIHYLSVRNDKNSYAVACDEPYSLGAPRISFNVRVPPNTKSQLFMYVAAH